MKWCFLIKLHTDEIDGKVQVSKRKPQLQVKPADPAGVAFLHLQLWQIGPADLLYIALARRGTGCVHVICLLCTTSAKGHLHSLIKALYSFDMLCIKWRE